ncbi:type VII secretion protein EccCa [Tessaracoccus sp. OH4464_COT-324]|uniref:type VII secretion protein EccCa n=1 Tax=Tessaracoccus sp. OH4464_COT-324 TaxID=2491059 RepID=UPI000F641CC8|nr:type VII secretion protein EccCa [Tessaracoccus sp. OH4464_COT-324]RRD46192.1 type VII secretion protein EccCa [Tessaracoccus sp. OH4464_COT-324]
MGVITFHRPKRVTPPAMPRGDLLLESPPEIPPPSPSKPFGAVLRMLPMAAGMLAMGLMMFGGFTAGMGGSNVLRPIIMGLYAVSMMGMMLTQTGRQNDDQSAQLDANRREYFRYLAQTRRNFSKTADEQRASVAYRHPEPESLWTVVGGMRMWERRPDTEDFASVRISVGLQQSAKRITPPESQPIEDLEPLTTGALRRFIRTHRLIQSVPLSVDLRGFHAIRLVGDEEVCRRMAYSMVAQLVTWHAPTDVALMVAASKERQEDWQWVKWLPHLQHPTEVDGVGSVRMFATGASEISQLGTSAQAADAPPSLMVILSDGVDGVNAQQFVTPTTRAVSVHLTGERNLPRSMEIGVAYFLVQEDSVVLHRRTSKIQHATTGFGRPDQTKRLYVEMLARAMSPYRMPSLVSADDGEPAEVVFEPPKDYPAMLGAGDPLTLDPRTAWRPRPLRNHLRIPFGTADDGTPVELDIKESAQGGMGPHGICIGATGSGKSEFLRTLVLGLAMTHSTEQLNFILVDFKGGATFLGLEELPHVSAVITNLEGELSLVDRMQDAIGGELDRRMEVLRAAGNFKNREDYENARQAGADIPPMPSLLIVVDEFSELLSARPEFIDLFVQIGRVGRSIAVHQLLASQRLEENKLRGLDTFLSYRIALRTFSPAESRTVIGVPDAYELPTPPGNGYLKFDTTGMTRFKAAYVSGPWHGTTTVTQSNQQPMDEVARVVSRAWTPPALEFTADYVIPVVPPEPEAVRVDSADPGAPIQPDVIVEPEEDEEEETLLSICVSRLKGHGWPAHQVWLPPLNEPPTMDQLLNDLEESERGLQAAERSWLAKLRAPVGIIDRPRHQRRDPWWMDFSGAGGNLGVVGGPQSGKSMALRAAIAGLSLTHTPKEVGFYCLDFGGGGLMSMRELAHVGSVTGRLDIDRVRRTVAELTSLRGRREQQFAELGIDSMATYRRGRADGTITPDRFPTDVFLVIDGWATLKTEFEEMEPQVQALAAGGLGFGIHVWVSAAKWSEIRAATKDMLQSRIELKLGDPFDSEIDRKVQGIIPANRPGRGITEGGLHTLIGLPRVDSVESADDVSVGQKGFIELVNRAWKGPRAAEVRMLPEMFSHKDLPQITHDPEDRRIPWAIDELELEPVFLDPRHDAHLAIIGGPECGKTTILRTLVHGIVARYTPKEAKIAIVDYRRTLLGELDSEHVIGYYASASAATDNLRQLAEALRRRLPGPDVTQQQLRDRSWWTGGEVFVVVDDYELVATPSGNPLAAFADLVNQAGDIGLHIIVARSSGGASRSVFGDPIIAKMREQISPGLVMSGSKDEGKLFGDVVGSRMPPGRGTLVTRTFKGLVQAAYRPPVDEEGQQ